MSAKSWSDLSPAVRKAIVAGATVDTALKAAALLDLKRRSAAEVRGSRLAWALALTLVSSAGLLPLTYFLRGRR
jgi:hypothetical protein